MHTSDARILRGAAIPSGLAGVAAIVVALSLAGSRGALGAALGTIIVIAFFTISVVAVSYASRVSPQMMFAAAVFSYITKIMGMFALIALLDGVTAWSSRSFAWTVLALTLVWIGAEIRTTMKVKTLDLAPTPEPRRAGGDAPVAADRSP
jgi:ATP synthase protein I